MGVFLYIRVTIHNIYYQNKAMNMRESYGLACILIVNMRLNNKLKLIHDLDT